MKFLLLHAVRWSIVIAHPERRGQTVNHWSFQPARRCARIHDAPASSAQDGRDAH